MAKDKLRPYGGIARELIGFSMPLILSGVLQQLYNWVDAFIVGHVEGQLAMGSVGATTACVNLFLAVMMGFTVGLNVLMAQRHGAGEDEKVPRILSSFSVILCAVFVVVGALGFFFAGELLALLDTTSDMMELSTEYLSIVFLGMPFLAVYNVYSAALRALAEAVAWVRAGAAENHVDPRQISVCGFSAGGHLAGSLGVFWNAPFLAAETGLAPQDMRPDKMVLCYPVITGGEFAHKGSFDNLLGADADAARRAEVSLEQHVTQDTPPAFLWHTYTDPGVPVENTMLFAMALRRAGVPFESHIYSVGGHGLSLANELTENTAGAGVQAECTGWVNLAAGWLRR